jgi:aminodeoxyfutalosine synthase
VAELHHLIREAGREPVERDTLYRRVVRDGKEWRIEEPAATIGASPQASTLLTV